MMKKKEILAKVKALSNAHKTDANTTINAFFATVLEALTTYDKAKLPLGSIVVRAKRIPVGMKLNNYAVPAGTIHYLAFKPTKQYKLKVRKVPVS